MTSDAVLAIIFITTLVLAGILRVGLNRPTSAKYALGIAALVLAVVSHLLHNDTVPSWLLVLAGALILLGARYSKKRIQ